ncbi:MAG: efflux RND transporter permease subunit [Alphaproteobacteria bacterium]|nr:efflux RND transporter permease subunit [Alphaproteobacteria bacterium]MDA7984870.1 efflux RND transporter permease subunit [Alphaproteobacteria bacterium]MDA7989223.1 efflux RND transporter permease subunit [Alphaproteobacteria bacterium]MDA7999723.1 efflux RND transporter permease subunit [Alphaproteobacteria bacterium]MDA8003632.1 efflux RND transporter permease subunit [Alphaproteobacteria bacterium]
MSHLIDAALLRKRSTLGLLFIFLISGYLSMLSIPRESEPDVQIPILYISMSQRGISPEDSERLLVRPMENKMRAVEGVIEMTSAAYSGGGFVQLEFAAGYSIDTALDDVRVASDEVAVDLPADADEPTVSEVNLSLFPIITVTLSSSLPERVIRQVAVDLSDSLESLTNVLTADVFGTLPEQVEVIIDPVKLESYGLEADTVLAAVASNNQVITAGTLDTGAGRFAVRVPGLYRSYEEIIDLPLRVNGDREVTVGDIAIVRPTFREPDSFVRVNGQNSVSVEITKRIGTNIIETIDQAKIVVEEESKKWPPGVTYAFSGDESVDIRRIISDLGNSVVTSILLVVTVLIATIGLRTALLVGFAIPASLLVAFMVISSIGFTLNIVVLFALILSVGLLVDGSIVMTEFADRKMSEGKTAEEAFREASHRMFWPITSSTATTLCAFLPLAFWPGTVGEFMKFLPITQIIVLTAALFMALIFLPTIGSIFGKARTDESVKTARAIARGGDLNAVKGFTGAYIRLLRRLIRFPSLVVLAAAAVLVGSFFAYSRSGQGTEFFPATEPDQAVIHVRAQGNFSAVERDHLVREAEAEILKLAIENGEMGSVYTVSQVSGQSDSDIIGNITIELVDSNLRRPATVILEEIRERTLHLAGIVIEPQADEEGPGGEGKPLVVRLTSNSPEILPATAARVRALMESAGGVVDIEDSLPPPELGVELIVDRTAAERFGANLSLVGNYVEMFTGGLKLASYRPDHTTEEVDIIARVPLDYRNTSQLQQLRIQTRSGLVPISSFVDLETKPADTVFSRVDQRRVVTVEANVGIDPATGREFLVSAKQAELEALLAEADLDPSVRYEFVGENVEEMEAQAFLVRAFMVAMALMAVILVTQFNSFFSALLILSAVIMSTTGVMLGLLITGQPFGIVMCGIGVIALAGIIVNNNIVLIDTYEGLRRSGLDVTEAILRTGAQRMRPVLLTACTTILGLMPLVLKLNFDFIERTVTYNSPSALWWVQLSTVIVFGLFFATPLTLLVTPSALVYKGRMEERARRRRSKKEGRRLAVLEATSRGVLAGVAAEAVSVSVSGGEFSWAGSDDPPTSEESRPRRSLLSRLFGARREDDDSED